MTKQFCHWLLFQRMGWKLHITEELPEKFIVCLAPHTSNWDFVIGQLFMRSQGLHINFLMKAEWFFWPLGPIFRRMGGIPVVRSKHTSMTDALAETARSSNTFRLCVTPEGTRSANPEWKRGFYFIAQKADIPILLFGADYERRLIECTKTLRPSGDVDEEMRQVKLYFKDYKGKKPEKFTIGEV